jgi:hypothetical protein
VVAAGRCAAWASWCHKLRVTSGSQRHMLAGKQLFFDQERGTYNQLWLQKLWFGLNCTETFHMTDPGSHSAPQSSACHPTCPGHEGGGHSPAGAGFPAPRPSLGQAGASAARQGSVVAGVGLRPHHCCPCPAQSHARPQQSVA